MLEELWQIKDSTAQKYGGDFHAMAMALREKQNSQGREVVSFAREDPAPYGDERKFPPIR